MTAINRFVDDENGSTALEYALISALVCIAVIASMNALGSNLSETWNKIAANVTR